MNAVTQVELPHPGIDRLLEEARQEGYAFLEPLLDDWASGTNRFDASGEIFCGYVDGDALIAIGGLNRDPFDIHPNASRIRRVTVRSAWRNKGIGTVLTETLVDEARKSFDSVTLTATDAKAARLYERMGFVPIENPHATHCLRFKS